MKKLLIYIIILAIALVISLNVFLFYTNSSLSDTLNNSSNIRNTIIKLDEFKTTITEMSDSQESFIITGNSKYKDDYTNSLNTAYDNADMLLNNQIISTEDKNTLVDLIKDYDSINQSIFNSTISYPASTDFESLVTNSSNAKVKLLHSVSNLIANHRSSLEKSSDTISNSIGTQKTFVSWISSIFTALITIPPLLMKKFMNNSGSITNSINSLISNNSTNSNEDESSPLNTSISTLETFFNFQNNIDGIKEVREQLIQNATLINYLNIVDFNNLEMSKSFNTCKTKLDTIITNCINIENIYKDSPSSDMSAYIETIKNSLDDLSIALENLYNYNEYMINISKLLLNKNIDS